MSGREREMVIRRGGDKTIQKKRWKVEKEWKMEDGTAIGKYVHT